MANDRTEEIDLAREIKETQELLKSLLDEYDRGAAPQWELLRGKPGQIEAEEKKERRR